MRTEQYRWSKDTGWEPQAPPTLLGSRAQLVLLFATPGSVQLASWHDTVRAAYPNAHFFGCTTSGQIQGTAVREDSVVVTAIEFEHTRVEAASVRINGGANAGYEAGQELGRALDPAGLRYAFAIGNAMNTNANDTVSGLNSVLPASTCLFGGCASDGHDLRDTSVICDGEPDANSIAAIGLYGDRLEVGTGSSGGWDPLGLDRLITKSKKNVLYELDGRPALPLYKKYMGSAAEHLPASGMLFPMSLEMGDSHKVLRGVIAVNEQDQSITFAGNVPEGAHARLMFGSSENLIDGAFTAAQQARRALQVPPQLLIVVSCVARQLVLKQRACEELESFHEVFEVPPAVAGFYALGEVVPVEVNGRAHFQNETLTVAALAEI
jgi:hypothetical protein